MLTCNVNDWPSLLHSNYHSWLLRGWGEEIAWLHVQELMCAYKYISGRHVYIKNVKTMDILDAFNQCSRKHVWFTKITCDCAVNGKWENLNAHSHIPLPVCSDHFTGLLPVFSCNQQSRGLLLTCKDGGTEKLLYMGTIAPQGLLHQVLCQRLLPGHHRTPYLC